MAGRLGVPSNPYRVAHRTQQRRAIRCQLKLLPAASCSGRSGPLQVEPRRSGADLPGRGTAGSFVRHADPAGARRLDQQQRHPVTRPTTRPAFCPSQQTRMPCGWAPPRRPRRPRPMLRACASPARRALRFETSDPARPRRKGGGDRAASLRPASVDGAPDVAGCRVRSVPHRTQLPTRGVRDQPPRGHLAEHAPSASRPVSGG